MMPNKTIYIRQDDVDLWARAERLAGGNVSGLLSEALRRYVEEEEQKQDVGRTHAGKEIRDAFTEAVDSGVFLRDGLTLEDPLGDERDFSGFEEDSVGRLLDLLWSNEDTMPRGLREHVGDTPFEPVMSQQELDGKMKEDGTLAISTYGEAARLFHRLISQHGEQGNAL